MQITIKRMIAAVALLLLQGCGGSQYSGDKVTENLQFNLPKHFKNLGGSTEVDGTYIRKYKNTIDSTETIAHYYFPNHFGPVINTYNNILTVRNYGDCRNKTQESYPKVAREGLYEVLSAGVDCQQYSDARASFAHYSIVKGEKGTYILERLKIMPINYQRPLHGEGLDKGLRNEWIEFFNSAYLCTYHSSHRKCVKIKSA